MASEINYQWYNRYNNPFFKARTEGLLYFKDVVSIQDLHGMVDYYANIGDRFPHFPVDKFSYALWNYFAEFKISMFNTERWRAMFLGKLEAVMFDFLATMNIEFRDIEAEFYREFDFTEQEITDFTSNRDLTNLREFVEFWERNKTHLITDNKLENITGNETIDHTIDRNTDTTSNEGLTQDVTQGIVMGENVDFTENVTTNDVYASTQTSETRTDTEHMLYDVPQSGGAPLTFLTNQNNTHLVSNNTLEFESERDIVQDTVNNRGTDRTTDTDTGTTREIDRMSNIDFDESGNRTKNYTEQTTNLDTQNLIENEDKDLENTTDFNENEGIETNTTRNLTREGNRFNIHQIFPALIGAFALRNMQTIINELTPYFLTTTIDFDYI